MKKRPLNPLTNLYNQNNINEDRLRRDLSLFTYAVALGSIFFSVSTGTPFTGFTSALGANDIQYSILLGVPVAFSLLQFFASRLLEKTRKRKFIFIFSGLIQRSLWIPVALVPFFVPMSQPVLRLWLVVLLISMSSVAGMFMNVTFFSWLGDIVPIHIRGRYLSLRYSISTATGLLSAIIASIVLDLLPGMNGYTFVFGVVALFGVGDIVLFLWIHDPPMKSAEHEPFFASMKGIFKDKGFVLYLLFWTAWMFTWNLSGPFFSKYCIDMLGLNLKTTTIAGQVAAGVMAMLLAQWWGQRLDWHGHHWVLSRCCVVLCVLPVVWVFAAPNSFWPLLVFSIGNGIFFAGLDVTSVQMLVTVTPQRNRSMFVAMYMVVTSLFGVTIANLVGGSLLNIMGNINFTLFGMQFDRYKILFIGAGLLRLLVVLFLLPMIANLVKPHEDTVDLSNTERNEEDGGKELA